MYEMMVDGSVLNFQLRCTEWRQSFWLSLLPSWDQFSKLPLQSLGLSVVPLEVVSLWDYSFRV